MRGTVSVSAGAVSVAVVGLAIVDGAVLGLVLRLPVGRLVDRVDRLVVVVVRVGQALGMNRGMLA